MREHQAPGRRVVLPIIAVLLTGSLAIASATTSFAQPAGPGAGGPGYDRGVGPGYGPGNGPGWRHWGFGRGGSDQFDPARFEARADRMVRHLAVELGASAEQQDKLGTIVKAALKDLLPMRDKMRTARQQARDLLTAQTVDRTALEKLRADQIAAHDAASKRLVQALADAADVLTPDQRKKLNDMLPPNGRGFGRGWAMGHGRGMMGGWGMGGMGGGMGGWR